VFPFIASSVGYASHGNRQKQWIPADFIRRELQPPSTDRDNLPYHQRRDIHRPQARIRDQIVVVGDRSSPTRPRSRPASRAMPAPVGCYRSVMYCPGAGCHQSSHGPVAAGDRAGGHSSYVHGSTAAQAAPNLVPFMAIAPGAVGVYWVAVSQRGGAVDLLGSEPTRAARLLRGFACHGCSVRRVRRCATA